jgi:hypothetical protein
VVDFLLRHDILCYPVNEKWIRWVFHLDVTEAMMGEINNLPNIWIEEKYS